MISFISFIIGCFVGTLLGVFVMALMFTIKKADQTYEEKNHD